jgi:hypothetical protein
MATNSPNPSTTNAAAAPTSPIAPITSAAAPQPIVFSFPTGLNIADYSGYQSWSNQEWAWEFLRRNTDFQKRSDHIRNWPNSKLTRSWQRNIAYTFGLKKFKDYIEDFASGQNPKPKLTSGTISAWSRVDEKVYASLVLPTALRPGQSLIRFDIEAMKKSKKSFNAQLQAAKTAIEKSLKIYLKSTNSKSRITKLKAPLIEFLRAFDAEMYKRTVAGKKTTYLVMANSILPQSPPPLNPEDDIKDRVGRSKEFVESLYLDLAAS